MNAKRLDRFEKLLLEERARVVDTLARLAVPVGADMEAAPGDDGVAGIAGASPDDDAAVVARETVVLHDIDEALRRIHESPHDYGICEQCGRPIPDERLALLPAAHFCGRGAGATQR